MPDELARTAVDLAVTGVRFYAALLLIAAAVAKLRNRADAARSVSAYQVLPSAFERPAAALLPFVELAAGLAVALVPHPGCAVAASGLFALFAAAIAINLVRGRRSLECGCGFGARKIGPALLVHNLVLAVLLSAGSGNMVTMTPLAVLFALFWAGAMLALLLGIDTISSIATPAKRQNAR